MFHEARTPEGWPEPTPVGQVQVKEYPACRVAVVEADQARQGDQDSMFMTLFKHIKANDIKMTAPVQMTYAPDAGSEASEDEARPVAMAFLYFSQTQGTPGVDGAVEVRDVPARRVVSLGVRGDYTSKHLKQAVAQLRAYLDEHADQYTPTGPPRYLGYNSPFVPWFLKYGEVQIPIDVNQSP
ncbi:hypothetical protein HED60_12575 [Planctomycetales bacterium ZRK34]|nr:hypothetical protein HED60_12575 [Planctomycetales bacterium ZRK34]